MRAVNQNVFKNPADAGGVRPKHWDGPLRQSPGQSLNVFEHSRTSPVQVGAILKDHEYVRISKHGLRADSFYMRRREQGSDDWIRDLIFNDIRWTSRPRRMNDNLHIGNVG